MELKDLSNNWKKLQHTLKKDQNPETRKRKASDEILQPRRNGAKRLEPDFKVPKTSSQSKKTVVTNDKSMGILLSKPQDPATSASLALWAEDNDIPVKDLAAAYGPSLKTNSLSTTTKNLTDTLNAGLSPNVEAGKYVALDCEMVGVGPNPNTDSALARVSIVNYHGQQLYDSFVLPKEAVTDYRTPYSGITPQLLQSARPFGTVQADIAKLLDGKILVGHAIRNDLDVMMLGHPRRDIRDTSKYPGYRSLANGRSPALKKLAMEVLGVEIQSGEHSSVEDARATMLLFRREKAGFEREHVKRWGPTRRPQSGKDDEEGEVKRKGKKKKRNK